MTPEELNEARTNPDFIKYINEKEKEAFDNQNISELYSILDTLLILDLSDENRINKVYEEILTIAFEAIQDRIKEKEKLSIDTEDIYFIRSFYEHAIEKWSVQDYKGAKELFFILTRIVEDNILVDAFNIHLINTSQNIDMDDFYEKVDMESEPTKEQYGYFISNFNFDTKEYLDSNISIITKEYENLKNLLN
ncbi:MAG: hypothetical protein U9Q30_00980 [Campylobacterota bacterium]|nr:hypothetical protein [Campylobacterota bacterium]